LTSDICGVIVNLDDNRIEFLVYIAIEFCHFALF
jgi:hypothetical protein